MATNRKIILANDEIYHVFNRGVEKRPTFIDKREFQRAIDTLRFYRFSNLPFKLSKFFNTQLEERTKILQKIEEENKKLVEIICFVLMPNHFHFLLKQLQDNGTPKFLANFTNSYTKYFNTKNERVGPLFQGRFKAVHIESDEQFMHISRYIHINPVVSSLIKVTELENYLWSSYPEYLNLVNTQITDKKQILDFFKSENEYKKFVLDQVDYGRKLEQIKHLALE